MLCFTNSVSILILALLSLYGQDGSCEPGIFDVIDREFKEDSIQDKALELNIEDGDIDNEDDSDQYDSKEDLEDDILLEEIDLDNASPKESPKTVDMKRARLNIIDIGFGKSHIFDIDIGTVLEFDKADILISKCIRDNEPTLVAVSRALVSIKNRDSNELIFEGWIFSGYKSLGQPFYKNYFFTLNDCLEGE